jgi:hypothetical protein
VTTSPLRHAPLVPLPPYSFVPGHGFPHPVTDPAGHLHGREPVAPLAAAEIAALPVDPVGRREAITSWLTLNPHWLHAIDLFNAGYYWEAHEAWESLWHVLGRTTPEARLVQGLIRLAAACVKIREGSPEGVKRHTLRARELLGDAVAVDRGADASGSAALGLSCTSIASLLGELDGHRPECWHTSRTPVVRVLTADLRLAGTDDASDTGGA